MCESELIKPCQLCFIRLVALHTFRLPCITGCLQHSSLLLSYEILPQKPFGMAAVASSHLGTHPPIPTPPPSPCLPPPSCASPLPLCIPVILPVSFCRVVGLAQISSTPTASILQLELGHPVWYHASQFWREMLMSDMMFEFQLGMLEGLRMWTHPPHAWCSTLIT